MNQVMQRAPCARSTRFHRPPNVQTWREKQHIWIDAISNEKLLTVFLFGIISMVAIFLVFCIFYMIVMEKTKDIGIIKSVGATSLGRGRDLPGLWPGDRLGRAADGVAVQLS